MTVQVSLKDEVFGFVLFKTYCWIRRCLLMSDSSTLLFTAEYDIYTQ